MFLLIARTAAVQLQVEAVMITREFADHFAQEWVAAWNSHDLERVLAHYSDDFVMSSPRIAIFAGEPSGVLRGKEAIGEYWQKALGAHTSLHFKLLATFVGADSVALHYQGVGGPAIEVFFFNDEGKVVRAAATYL